MISMSAISKDYEVGGSPVHALRELDLEIGAGESVALLGPSGSGKSTLMHLIGCLDTPTRGSYRFEGGEVGALDINALAALRCAAFGFVFQSFHLMPRASAWENVAMPMRFAGVPAAERKERAAALLDRVGLADRREHRPSELSGGQQQRVAIARALANQPRVILADEPTGNLDSASGAEIVALLDELHAEGRTIVTVTHDDSLAERAQRIVRLLDGRIV